MNGYFDHNATTPMSPRAREVWLELSQQHWHNPSSLYREAGLAKLRLEDYREELADYLDIDDPERVVFTSGATEANNAVIRHLAENLRGDISLSAIEHPCVEAPISHWFAPESIHEIPVDQETGTVSLEKLREQLSTGGIGAISIMAANNETGSIQPWEAISELCRSHEVLFHTDAAQWFGKRMPDGIAECDFVTGSGHKFGGGKGAGFLILPEGADFVGAVGGPQEHGYRGGTEDLPAIGAMVSALLEGPREMPDSTPRDVFEDRISSESSCRILGRGGERLWNTSMFTLPHTKNLKWLTRLSARGFSVSTGSACSAGQGNPSKVMAAMGLDFEEMGRALRVSSGHDTTAEDWKALASALSAIDGELAQ